MAGAERTFKASSRKAAARPANSALCHCDTAISEPSTLTEVFRTADAD